MSRAAHWLIAIMVCTTSLAARADSTAFYYGDDVPRELLAAYDQVVVEPSHVPDVAALSGHGAALVAYLSVGEVGGANIARIDPTWTMGQNAAWSSRVMDLTQPGYRKFVLEQYEQLWRAGYHRFFLDTLDSYELATTDVAQRKQQSDALCVLIRAFVERHPDVVLVLNRGFGLLPAIAKYVHEIVIESLFDGWDAANQRYVRVSESDRAWLTARMTEVQARYHLPITVIDYRPPAQREQARDTARRIAQLGYKPWVCNHQLDDIGIGALEIMPRRVYVLSEDADADVRAAPARWLAPVLEQLGYYPEYHTAAEPLKKRSLRGRYAGIITTLRSNLSPDYEAWLRTQLDDGVRVAIVGALGFAPDSALAHSLGITPVQPPKPGEVSPKATTVHTRDSLIGFEAEPSYHTFEGTPITLQGPALQRHLELAIGPTHTATAIATTAWGGVALSHAFALRGSHGERAWVVDPFVFLTKALALPEMPVPDVTTESGRRVAMFAIDLQGASGYARLRGRPLVSEVLAQRLREQPWPHALSVADANAPRDQNALGRLLSQGSSYPARLPAGSTALRGLKRSLTWLEPLFITSSDEPVVMPIAADTSYLEGSLEAYPIEQVLDTYQLTEQPRRLRPIALHYHAYAASSPGGLAALDKIYGWLAQQQLFPVLLPDYAARVRAFRDQVVARDLQGAYLAFAGAALRTWRIPEQLAEIDLEQSTGVVTVAASANARYVTFSDQPARRLAVGAQHTPRPHLIQTNGRVERWNVGSPPSPLLEFAVTASVPVQLTFAGLPAARSCELSWSGGHKTLHTDASGRVTVEFPQKATGRALLRCGPTRKRP